VIKVLGNIAHFVRWYDWGPGKVPVLCTVSFYVGLASHQLSPAFTRDVVLFVVYAMIHSALGYVINDFGDRDVDARHGKPNAFAQLTRSQGRAALGSLVLLAFLSGLPFVQRPMVLPLWIGWVAVTVAYSLKPLRFKERGVWGLAVSFIAQWSLPILLTFAAFNRFGGWDMILFAVALTTSGATLEIAHQRWDRMRDLSTQTATLGSRISADRLDRLYSAALLLDRLAIGIIVLTITFELTPVTIGPWMVSPALPLLGIYIILFVIATYETVLASSRGMLLDPYYSTGHSATKLLHETLSNLVLPAYLMVLATVVQPVNGLLLLLFLFWRLVLGQADWRWPLRALINWWHQQKQSRIIS